MVVHTLVSWCQTVTGTARLACKRSFFNLAQKKLGRPEFRSGRDLTDPTGSAWPDCTCVNAFNGLCKAMCDTVVMIGFLCFRSVQMEMKELSVVRHS